jgi:hypothetical protein
MEAVAVQVHGERVSTALIIVMMTLLLATLPSWLRLVSDIKSARTQIVDGSLRNMWRRRELTAIYPIGGY